MRTFSLLKQISVLQYQFIFARACVLLMLDRSKMDPSRITSKPEREWVINHLEDIFMKYGNLSQRSSGEIEGQLFERARSPDEYMSLARRLLRHLMDAAILRRSNVPIPSPVEADIAHSVITDGGGGGDGGLKGGGSCDAAEKAVQNSHWLHSANELPSVSSRRTSPKLKNKAVFQPPTPVVVADDGDEEVMIGSSGSSKSRVVNASPKRRILDWVMEANRRRRSSSEESGASLPLAPAVAALQVEVVKSDMYPHHKPEVVVAGVGGVDLSEAGESLSKHLDTYQAQYTFMVPKNCVISKIYVHLEKNEAENS